MKSLKFYFSYSVIACLLINTRLVTLLFAWIVVSIKLLNANYACYVLVFLVNAMKFRSSYV